MYLGVAERKVGYTCFLLWLSLKVFFTVRRVHLVYTVLIGLARKVVRLCLSFFLIITLHFRSSESSIERYSLAEGVRFF